MTVSKVYPVHLGQWEGIPPLTLGMVVVKTETHIFICGMGMCAMSSERMSPFVILESSYWMCRWLLFCSLHNMTHIKKRHGSWQATTPEISNVL